MDNKKQKNKKLRREKRYSTILCNNVMDEKK